MTTTTERGLFGGAIVAQMPSNLIDASEIRQVPDTQEVFLYPDSSISIIAEILQRVEPTNFTDAAKFHFDSLAHDNAAESSVVHEVLTVPNDRGDDTPSPILLSGTQQVRKFNRTSADEVRILLGLYRVERKSIDLVITMNVPMISEDGGAVGEEGWSAAKGAFDALVRSLRIVDYGLFA
ncbi:hypothetical protein PLICRDRAFT_109092 [Plicaturopsis crispa FD-325 SS-3]|nr:hypothetical protein PLICRDRAFT_109092 [Plicaturopsis crispa FD-325 SS-3]